MKLITIAKLFGYSCSSHEEITTVCIDSRQVKKGALFVAIPGERFDGHEFIADALVNGAIAILCNKVVTGISVPQWVVPDSIHALTELAIFHRKLFSLPMIAVTGSNGKTSVKEMIATILPQPSHATRGNLNNHLGVPLNVLGLNAEHRYAVFELGASKAGDIAQTVNIVQPKIALINNIAPAHLAGFGSIDGVAKAKGEIYQGLPDGGIAVVNEDDDYAHFWDDMLINKNVLRFSSKKASDVSARDIEFDHHDRAHFNLVFPSEQVPLVLQVPGRHSVQNALAAATCCYAAGIPSLDIVKGLEQFRGVKGRLHFVAGKNQSIIIDDSYNANLGSVFIGMDVLAKRQGHRILVLGDLAELGEMTALHHTDIGHAAAALGLDLVMTCGSHSQESSKAFGSKGRHYLNQEELAQDLLRELNAKTTVLVKGSRSAAMEKIVSLLMSDESAFSSNGVK